MTETLDYETFRGFITQFTEKKEMTENQELYDTTDGSGNHIVQETTPLETTSKNILSKLKTTE